MNRVAGQGRRSALWLGVGVFVVALAVRGAAVGLTGFDGLYGQDPFAYYNYSLQLRQALLALQPPPPFFWPIGYPLLVVLATFLLGTGPLAAQTVSIVMGAAVAPATYLIAREIKREAVVRAVVAALIVATGAQLMLSSVSVMSDAAGLAWATLSAWCMLRSNCLKSRKWLVLAALTLALAILTRWVYGLLVLPWAASAVAAWGREAFRPRQLASGVMALLIGVAIIGGQLVLDGGEKGLSHTGDLQVVGWNPANAFRSTIVNDDGLFAYERPIGLYYALPAVHPAFVFPLFAPFLLVGLWGLWGRPFYRAVLLVGWPLTVYVFLAGIAWQNPRFSLALFPPLAVLVGLGVDAGWRKFGQRDRTALLAWCGLALAGSLAWAARDVGNFAAWKASHLEIARWVEAQAPPDATVVSIGLTLTIDHYTPLKTEDIYLLDETSLERLVAEDRPVYVLLDTANVEAQWQGRSPYLNYLWLQANTRLEEVGRFAPYTLFRVERPS